MFDVVTAAYVQSGVALAVGMAQVGIIWMGIKKMSEASENRARQVDHSMRTQTARHEETMRTQTARHEETMRTQADRHEETMRTQADRHEEAMRTQTARHEETMRTQADQHAETMEALRQQGEALRTLIERTAPSAGAGRQEAQ